MRLDWRRGSHEELVALLRKMEFLFYLFIFRQMGREGERERTLMCERYIDWLPLTRPQPVTWPARQTCALTRNPTSNPLVHS